MAQAHPSLGDRGSVPSTPMKRDQDLQWGPTRRGHGPGEPHWGRLSPFRPRVCQTAARGPQGCARPKPERPVPGPSSPGPGAPSSAQLRGVLFFRTRCREDVFPRGGSKSGGGWDGGEEGRWKPRAVRAWRGKRWAEGAPRSGAQGPSTGSEPAAPLQSHLQPLALALKQNLPREARRSTWSRNEAWFGGAGLGQPSPSVSRPTSAVKAKVKAKVREATGRAPSAVLVRLVNNASFLLPNGRGSWLLRPPHAVRPQARPPSASRFQTLGRDTGPVFME